ncbi:MAG: homocysteine S-methyltransferase family protein [Candidatus Omnitrophota bacterium]|nr:MAG: homocysteine S-methyltransferase family protein [Candidatus Omnitrophota bacterium]
MKNKIANLLKKKVVILDGATGTQLQKANMMPQGACPEEWCLQNPQLLAAVHSSYRCAGSDIVYACTFGANRFKLKEYNLSNVEEINKNLVGVAKRAVAAKALVAGDIGPTGQFIKPFGDLDFQETVDVFKQQVRGLLAGGVDLFVVETMIDIQEARAALLAIKELTDKFVIVTMTFEGGRTLNGTDPVTAVVTLGSLGADAVGCNCSSGPQDMLKTVAAMKPYATVPIVAKPNAGIPKLVGDRAVFDMGATDFASFAPKFVKAGVNMLGGCCGTTPQHISALVKRTKNIRPLAPLRKSISAVSSARKTVVIDANNPFIVIGERINPTGKKVFKQKLLEGNLSVVRAMAVDQRASGAHLLDVNVGMPDIDEVKTMISVIELLCVATDLPLVIDSSNVAVIEEALRFYPGRALINSISAEEPKFRRLLPLAAKYGAMFILLPLSSKQIPATAAERKVIIKKLFKEAQKLRITKDDIIVDAMAMAVSSDAGAAIQTLKTIEWCSKILKCHTVVGLSNVSFGLPARKWINAAFLALGQRKGLTCAIMDPLHKSLEAVKEAVELLLQKDKMAASYIARFAKVKEKEVISTEKLSPQEKVFRAILEGNREGIKGIIQGAVAAGVNPSTLVYETMIGAITKVGELFDRREYFLPQLIASAETMKQGFSCLKAYLKEEPRVKAGVILLATVKGDIHDIGKNIVALMLSNHGFKVIDLGKDVSAERIVEGIKKYNPAVVGLSALMTTTMVNMGPVINLAEKQSLTARFIVGGAVVTKGYAQSMGADYAKDGVEAVRVVKKIVSKD